MRTSAVATGAPARRFDWDLVAGRSGGVPAIVAGGLTPDNVGEAIAVANPWGVDVAGGVESEGPGIKDHNLIESFMAAAEPRRRDPARGARPAASAQARPPTRSSAASA